MKAVSPVLYQSIKELQSLKSLQSFALAGGTNLAVRYDHRESIDIDLFCTEIIGFKGF
ncbi:Nucleotidyl transferase AbiEii toxin, Type IV TA system [Salegentibacter agarivorans]|uniref:Nucleotidyl transferase AbiEii toxin, Type IV TA system n=1 Tax=Salegentibacter agarivorans TaxID=345907 RepID=A0A1I2LGB2_9FLAO|nr:MULTISPECIES: nucleotidyl transferase AbiEii/AbiGii toxin family protein [Salegentibacter]SFF77588.1 Nucleotidyl transferase AbiEii toxin, Type IV TA system [Salegentibacter agarivorans]